MFRAHSNETIAGLLCDTQRLVDILKITAKLLTRITHLWDIMQIEGK